jgi:hypothetical protein
MIMTNLSKRMKVTTILGISLSIVMASCSTKEVAAGQTPVTSNTGLSSSRSEVGKESTYVDGIHSAIGDYGSNDSSVGVTITLVDDVITGIQITPQATDPTSLGLQQRFADAIPAVVVGKRIDEVNIDRLAVPSPTPGGFETAIEQIKEQNRIGPTPTRNE